MCVPGRGPNLDERQTILIRAPRMQYRGEKRIVWSKTLSPQVLIRDPYLRAGLEEGSVFGTNPILHEMLSLKLVLM